MLHIFVFGCTLLICSAWPTSGTEVSPCIPSSSSTCLEDPTTDDSVLLQLRVQTDAPGPGSTLEGDAVAPPDGLSFALAGASASDLSTEQGKLNVINGILESMTPHMAEHNHDLITSSDVATVTGVRGEDVGCNEKLNSHCYQGDMQAKDDEQLLLFQAATEARKKGKRIAAGTPWTAGSINYCYASDIDPNIKTLWELSMMQVQKAVPCLSFHDVSNPGQHTSVEKDTTKECGGTGPAIFVQSSPTEGCWSFVGMLPPPFNAAPRGLLKAQLLNLKPKGCDVIGIAIHELGHALGMAHEQSRPDRSSYVTIHWENIKKGTENNFVVDDGGYTGLAYDYESLMHYSSDDFSKNGQPTITAADPSFNSIMGQRVGLAQSDANQLAAMYNETVSGGCTASSTDGNMGCQDIQSCAKLKECSTQEHMENCCGCGGGRQYKCWTGGECNQPPALPVANHQACILDQTHLFGGAYPCVVQNVCAYKVRIKSECHPGYKWDYSGPSGYNLPPGNPRWNEICTGSCTYTYTKI